MTKGARLMLSTPPAMKSSPWPVRGGARRIEHGGEAAAAEAVDGERRRSRSAGPRQQRGMARDVARVLAGLVGAADDRVLVIRRA